MSGSLTASESSWIMSSAMVSAPTSPLAAKIVSVLRQELPTESPINQETRREFAIHALGSIGATESIPDISDFLSKGDSLLRGEIVTSLAALQATQYSSAIHQILK